MAPVRDMEVKPDDVPVHPRLHRYDRGWLGLSSPYPSQIPSTTLELRLAKVLDCRLTLTTDVP